MSPSSVRNKTGCVRLFFVCKIIIISLYTYFITSLLRSRTAVTSLPHFRENEFGIFILMFFLWHRILETVCIANMTYTLILVRFHLHISVLVPFFVAQHWWRICTFILKYDNKYTYNETLRSVRILASSTSHTVMRFNQLLSHFFCSQPFRCIIDCYSYY
jgi:hypothetical protein